VDTVSLCCKTISCCNAGTTTLNQGGILDDCVYNETNRALTSLTPQRWESPDNMRQAALIPQIVLLYRLDFHITVCLSWRTEFVWLWEPEASSKSNLLFGVMTCRILQDWSEFLAYLSTASVFWKKVNLKDVIGYSLHNLINLNLLLLFMFSFCYISVWVNVWRFPKYLLFSIK